MPTFNFIIGAGLLLLAFIGGLFGTWSNIRNARGTRERHFAIRVSAACWLIVLSMLAVVTFTEGALRKYVLVAYFFLAPILIYRWSIKHQLIRMLDQRENDDQDKG